MSETDKFRFAIDRGGTFTDIYAEVSGEPGVMVVKRLAGTLLLYCFNAENHLHNFFKVIQLVKK